MCCGEPTIMAITMQELHNNDKIEPHNHNEYPSPYKEAEIPTLSFGRFLECRRCNTYISYNTGICALSDICALSLGHRAYTSSKAFLPVL